jgi:hypothetical protein
VPKKYIDQDYPLDTIYAKIKWEENCNYTFIYDETKMKLDDGLKAINNIRGLSVQYIEIKGAICKLD